MHYLLHTHYSVNLNTLRTYLHRTSELSLTELPRRVRRELILIGLHSSLCGNHNFTETKILPTFLLVVFMYAFIPCWLIKFSH